MTSEAKCLTHGCQRKACGRGLCKACHQAATSLIKTGDTSWEELENFGLAQQKGAGLFMQAYLKKKKAR